MRILIAYYSQSGNTQKIARQIRDGLRTAGAEVTCRFLNKVTYEELEAYDCLGLGSPIWYEMPPNVRKFVEEMPDQNGRLAFSFCTHCTMPNLYFPLVIPRLQRKGLRVVDWKNWYGDSAIQIFPEPYYTHGHPDATDLKEAYDWGGALFEKLRGILAGEPFDFPPAPEPDMLRMHANAAIEHLGGFHNVHGRFVRDPEKCLYPKCHICMDNCTMGYIDLAADPPKFGSCGNACDDPHGCTFCELLCPTGAIHPVVPFEEAAPVGEEHSSELFETVLDKAEAEGKFRRLIPLSEVGTKTPFYSVYDKHPRRKALRYEEDA